MSHPNYYGIITATIRYSKKLTDFQKILYSDITALANRYGYCTASNQYFAELFGKSKGSISRAISWLEKEGHFRIKIIYKKGTKEVIGRRLYPLLVVDVDNPLDEEFDEVTHTPKEPKPKPKPEDIILPEWLDVDAWCAWEKYRKEKGNKLTPSTTIKQIAMLEKNKPVHVQIINRSIENGWSGLFPIKNNGIMKEPEEGSIAWHSAQNKEAIDVEVE